MELTPDQAQALYREGWVRVPAVVSEPIRQAALRAINDSLGRGLDPRQVETFRARSFCPELQGERVITELLHATPAFPLAESLLGQGRIERVRSGQIALGFPAPSASPRLYPHLDGMYSPANGVPRGSILSFTLLVGVMLSDVPAPQTGNLLVWPGTHRLHEAYFRQRGPRSLLAGMPDVPLPEPVAVTGQAGDIVLCHYLLAHAAGANTSAHIRYAVYFRLKQAGHDGRKWEALTDLWREWPGMAPVVTAGA